MYQKTFLYKKLCFYVFLNNLFINGFSLVLKQYISLQYDFYKYSFFKYSNKNNTLFSFINLKKQNH